MLRIVVSIALTIVCVLTVSAQQPEWLLKIPKYYRLKGGTSTLSSDNTRNMIMFDGGAYDTYVTADSGATWRNVFERKMFYIDVSSSWQIDQRGRWYYFGRVYLKLNMNLVSEDAGATLRYLFPDSSVFGDRFDFREQIPRLIQPDALVFDNTIAQDSTMGIIVTTDAGRSTKVIPVGGTYSNVNFRTVKPGVMSWPVEQFAGTYELSMATGQKTTVDIQPRNPYLRLRDNTVVQITTDTLKIQRPGDSAFTNITTFRDPVTDTLRRISIRDIQPITDTMAVVYGRYGEVFTVGQQHDLRVASAPARYSNFQTVTAAGLFGDRFIVTTCIPEGTAAKSFVYTVINTRTGMVATHERPGASRPPVYENEPGNQQRILPVTDSMWFASFFYGEFMRTTNAGVTWSMVDNIDRDPQWGESWVGINRLFPRAGGGMALITEGNRVMTQPSPGEPWNVTLLGPFWHRIRTGWDITGLFTRRSLMFDEDFGTRYRHRYGPSTLFTPNANEMWVSGDALLRYSSDGRFIDTLLPRTSRFVKQVTPKIIASAMDSLYFTFNGGREWVYVGATLPRRIVNKDTTRAAVGDILEAGDGTLIAGLRGMTVLDSLDVQYDSIPGGIVISTNSGDTWVRSGTDIDSNAYVSSLHRTAKGTILCVVSDVRIRPWKMSPFDGSITRVSPLSLMPANYILEQSDIYRSTDNGRSWKRVYSFLDRPSLGTTDIRFADMPDGRVVAIHPSFGIAISADDGTRWSIGDPLNVSGSLDINDIVFTPDGYAHLATSEGYLRIKVENIVSVQDRQGAVGNLSAYTLRDGTLRVAADEELLDIAVLTLDGQRVASVLAPCFTADIPTTKLASGAYVVVATTRTGIRRSLVML
ncbi:MAG: exo-alpha-sialidase [Candidatus Kapabacteria bacterium]|nr:exo-alpha-sialidase [Candidatus Kapabacteria bacterium]